VTASGAGLTATAGEEAANPESTLKTRGATLATAIASLLGGRMFVGRQIERRSGESLENYRERQGSTRRNFVRNVLGLGVAVLGGKKFGSKVYDNIHHDNQGLRQPLQHSDPTILSHDATSYALNSQRKNSPPNLGERQK